MTENRVGAAALDHGDEAAEFLRADDTMQVRVNRTLLRRVVPLVVILGGIGAFFYFDWDSYVTFDALKQNRAWLLVQVAGNAGLTAVAFMLAYAAIVAFSLPGAAVMSIAGGFLFGQWMGMGWNILAATIGATALFLVAQTAWGDLLHEKAGPWLQRFEKGFQENALSYLLAMRLVPVFPFFVVNLVPAFLGVRLRTFVTATFFGIMPGAFVYSSVGAGLGSIFESGESFTGRGILTPEIITAIAGLIGLSLLPVGYRLWLRHK